MQIRLLAISVVLPLAACAPMEAPAEPGPPPAETVCDTARGQSFIGQIAGSTTGAALLRATGARSLRWVAPGMMVTMDYRADRLTVHYDANYKITQVNCG